MFNSRSQFAWQGDKAGGAFTSPEVTGGFSFSITKKDSVATSNDPNLKLSMGNQEFTTSTILTFG
jgi:hypothetical protein